MCVKSLKYYNEINIYIYERVRVSLLNYLIFECSIFFCYLFLVLKCNKC